MSRRALRNAAEQPPSTSGTPHGRAPRWSLRASLVAAAAFAVAAPVVIAAADPASAPRQVDTEVTTAEVAPEPSPKAAAAEARLQEEGPVGISHLGAHALLRAAGTGHELTKITVPATTSTTTTSSTAPAPEEPAAKERVEQKAPAPEPEPAVAAAPAPAPEPQPAPPPPAPPVNAGSVWDSLAQCEASGNWHINTGNGYYGGLQFSLSSWRAVGGTGYPHEHSREHQIAMGERLRANGGWGHWPSCSRQLGLR